MTAADPGVVVVGDALVDVLVDERGERRRVPGGAGLNLAMSVRRLGLRAALAAPFADDEDGRWLASVARGGGVRLVPLAHPGPTGVATSRRTAGEPEYEFSETVRNRWYAWDPASVAAVAAAGRVLVVNSFPMHDPAQAGAIVDLVTATGQRLVLDPNVRPSLMSDVAAYRDGFVRMAAAAEVVKLGLQDVTALGLDDPARLVDDLLAGGVRVVLLTRGGDGAELVTAAGHRIAVPVPFRADPVVDTMGAGDAALAVLAAGVARDGTELGADRWHALAVSAMDAAADVCRVPGGVLPLHDTRRSAP